MDVLGVQQMKIRKSSGGDKRRCKKGVKVVYISSPMKVKTCASKFRALVQELTGKDSDAYAAALQISNADTSPNKVVVDRDVHENNDREVSAEGDLINSPCCTIESPFDDDLFMPQREGSFLGMFTSNLFHQDFNFQLDHALKSFDSV
ncbi:sigma factor binding protein 1, chloroplastic-like [Melia azedarach]|uniref:Sigma factor binding protein 1, chloroplastic-like n=1 Tax=Melia azedarach TaxID=155640 RepID=A0ACC1YAD3_MELAZ|nr:sigma factor binding protein 1, chloroplastic-like [Melia azedarach]